MTKRRLTTLATACTICLGLAYASPGQSAELGGDDAGQFKSITVTKLAREGLAAAQSGNWPIALQKYSQATKQSSIDTSELNYGLFQAAARANDWNTAYSALENIFSKNPEAKSKMQAEYGQALTGIGRYEEAIPILKKALLTDDGNYLDQKLVAMATKIRAPGDPTDRTAADIIDIHKALPKFEPPPLIKAAEVNLNTSKAALNYPTLFSHSEFIAICTYKGYEKDRGGDITYFHPPIAIFRIDEILKGPPHCSHFPLRYDFHDRSGDNAPKDWKFGPDKMPKKDEQFLIFVENFVPLRNAYEAFRGSYGRQPATEENKNAIYKIIEEHRGQQ